MSFGFGVGDFLAVIQLAIKIRKRFSDAPAKLQDISYEVKSLSILLSDVAVHADTVVERIDPLKADELKAMVDGPNRVLQDLDNLLTRYETLNPSPGTSERNRMKRIWERLIVDPGEIADLRARLTSNITLLEAFLTNITERNTQKSLARLERQVDEQEREQILDWISKDCKWHIDRLKWFIGRHEPGTRKWLFESPEWQTWTSDRGRGTTLFCPGIPGAGKTHASATPLMDHRALHVAGGIAAVLERETMVMNDSLIYYGSLILYAAVVIDKLNSTFLDEVGVAFAFCDYQRSDEREHVDLARNLLRMILDRPQAWPDAVRQVYESSRRSRSEIGLDEVFDLLKASMLMRKRNFVVIDAMDELDHDARAVLVPKLFELQHCTGLNIFVTSRDIAQTSDLFSATPRLRIKATGEDIEQYISTHMATPPSFVSKNTQLQNEFKEAVVQAAGEMFLLAVLHIRSLKNKSSPKKLRQALQSFSSGPDSTREALENAMQRVTTQPEEKAYMGSKALMILTTARRPLTEDELCHALAVDLEDLEEDFDEENVPTIDYVLSSCAGLVIVEAQSVENVPGTTMKGVERPSGSRLVQVAHKSIRDYLSSLQTGLFRHAEARMAAICIMYKKASGKFDDKQGFLFLDYVVNHWGYHQIKSYPAVAEASMEQNFEMGIARQESFPLSARQAGDQFGLQNFALELEGTREDLLMWACRESRMNVVEILLANNLSPYQKPLTRLVREIPTVTGGRYAWCSLHGEVEIRDIYPRGKNHPENEDCSWDICTRVIPDTRMISGALVLAAAYGNIPIAETLIGYGASIAGRSAFGFTALGMAASKGHIDMLGWLLGQDSMDVKLFLELQPRLILHKSLEVGDKNWALQPPRRHARFMGGGFVSVNRYIAGEDRDGRVAVTTLVVAAYSGHEMCVRMLLDWMQKHYSEANVAELEASCMNAILCAIQRGHKSVVGILLPFVDVNSPAPGFNGYTLLHFAILMQNTEAARLILTKGRVDTRIEDVNGRTALALAARMGEDDLVQELWARGVAKVDSLALMEALLQGEDATFTLLCKLFLDCNPGGLFAADSSGYSCFDRIVFSYIREMADPSILPEQARIANIEDINPLAWTPIPLNKVPYVVTFYRDTLERFSAKLLDRGNSAIFGKADHPDGEYRFGVKTLYLALASCSYGLLRTLLQLYPSSVCDIDSGGGTILMVAFSRGSKQSIDLILETLEKQKDTRALNSVSVPRQHSALTAAIWNGRVNLPRQFRSLVTFPGFDLRLAFHPDENGDCPLVTLVSLTAQHTVLALKMVKPDQKRGIVTTCEKMYRKCWRLFNTLSQGLDREELSELFFRLSQDFSDRSGTRLIDCLCQFPRPGCLKILLRSCPALGSQLHVPDANGTTSLMHAAKAWRHHETFKFILKKSEADVGHRDEQGRTALSHVAEHLGRFSDGGVASTLIDEYGQDPLAADKDGWSPLRYAVANGNVWEGSPYHRLLGEFDTPLDWIDDHGSTPLHLAVMGGSPLAIKSLLQQPASSSWLNAVDADGLVPLAHFFSISKCFQKKSKYMSHFRMRYPYFGPALGVETSLQYHQEAKEAMRMMLSRPDIIPDIPDKDGKTPLWHALDGLSREYAAFNQKWRSKDSGGFHNFLQASIEALCDRDDVDPKKSAQIGKTPLDIAAELITAYHRRKTQQVAAESGGDFSSSRPGDPDSSLPGDVESSPEGDDANGRARLRVMINALRPMAREPNELNKRLLPRPRRRQEHIERTVYRGARKALSQE